MRTLKFIVEGQIIKKDPSCNFDDLVPGTEDYLEVEFSFSPEWDNCVKAVTFGSVLGYTFDSRIMKDGVSCFVPLNATKKRMFTIKIVGRRKGTETYITTNKITVTQNGGKA